MGINNQKGSSLVEVMVALFVLAIGLLGVLAMQSKSMQYNQSAHVYSQAVYLANDIAERIRNNPTVAASYLIAEDEDVSAATNCKTAACNPADLAEWDRAQLYTNVRAALPAGEVTIASPQARTFRIEVSFDDSRSEGKAPGSEEGYDGRKSYALMVEI